MKHFNRLFYLCLLKSFDFTIFFYERFSESFDFKNWIFYSWINCDQKDFTTTLIWHFFIFKQIFPCIMLVLMVRMASVILKSEWNNRWLSSLKYLQARSTKFLWFVPYNFLLCPYYLPILYARPILSCHMCGPHLFLYAVHFCALILSKSPGCSRCANKSQ